MSEIQQIYNVPYHIPLEIPIAVYFYLTGLSAGSFVISAVVTLGGRKEYKPIGRIGAVLAPILLIMAPFFLVIDMEQPMRIWHLFLYLNPQSPITYGSFLLTLYPISGLIYLFFLFRNNDRMSKVMSIVGMPLAISTHGYTGFILALGKGRALWSTALMPTLFIVSAMVSGIALVMLVAIVMNRFFRGRATEQERARGLDLILGLGKYLAAFIVADLFLLLNSILVLFTSTEESLRVVQMMLFGAFAREFVWVEIVLGSLVPLVLLWTPGLAKRVSTTLVASVLVLVGILSMRIVVVIAGQSIPLH